MSILGENYTLVARAGSSYMGRTVALIQVNGRPVPGVEIEFRAVGDCIDIRIQTDEE